MLYFMIYRSIKEIDFLKFPMIKNGIFGIFCGCNTDRNHAELSLLKNVFRLNEDY